MLLVLTVCGTGMGYAAMACYAESGTELGRPTRKEPEEREWTEEEAEGLVLDLKRRLNGPELKAKHVILEGE
eukprot:1570057-Rhodomonas_salina.1